MRTINKLPNGVKAALVISMKKEIEQFPNEDGIISDRLSHKLISLGIVDHSNVTFKEISGILALA